MSVPLARRLRRALCLLGLGLASAGSALATTTWTNPYTSTSQSTTVFTFTATSTGTLQGYFTGGFNSQVYGNNGPAFTDGVGVYLGNPTSSTSLPTSGLTVSSLTNASANINFGSALFGSGVHVTAGQTITFVLLANETNYQQCCTLPTVNKTEHYIWSDEYVNANSSSGGWGNVDGYVNAPTSPLGTTSHPLSGVSGANSNDVAMAYSTSVNAASGLTGQAGSCTSTSSQDCVPTGHNGTIAAGSYTYVGFNDWLGGQSNSYNDFSFLFNISTCTPGTPGCGGGSAPEPGSMALVAVALLGAAEVRRRRLAGARS